MTPVSRQRVVSGIQPTGLMHIGNFLGAIKQFVKLQEKAEPFYFIADLHALTITQNPEVLRKNSLNIAATFLAAGLNPQKAVLFVQSQVPAHSELAWILQTLAPLSRLKEMHQFKEKSRKMGLKAVNVGLFTYPVLQAADILLYEADLVPIGEDQKQHLELTRLLARRFNRHYGKIFKCPRLLVPKHGAKIKSLQDPVKKMAKSDPAKTYIGLFDSPLQIREKIMAAVTDSHKEIKSPNQSPGIENLVNIYALFSESTPQDVAQKFQGKGYLIFKKALAGLLIKKLTPIKERYQNLIKDPGQIRAALDRGNQKARQISEKKLIQVKKAVGLLAS
jgi:tryptophanyl-tRNA synthetase